MENIDIMLSINVPDSTMCEGIDYVCHAHDYCKWESGELRYKDDESGYLRKKYECMAAWKKAKTEVSDGKS